MPASAVVRERHSLGWPPAPGLGQDARIDVAALLRSRANALIIGDQFPVRRVLDTIWPSLTKPVRWMDGRRFVLPVEAGGTLVLDAGDALRERDQASFLGWLSDNGRSGQVLTTSLRPLFPLVEAGLFLDVLYYRLNTVCIDAGSLPS